MIKLYTPLKTILATATLFIGINSIHAQEKVDKKETTETDTIVVSKSIKVTTEIGKKDYDDRGNKIKYPRVFGGLTFTRIDWGFSRLIDNGSFTLGEDSKFLSYSKASNFGFDIAQFGVRASDAVKFYVSTGFEWNYLRLKKDIILTPDQSPLSYEESDIHYKKNVLTSTYLRIPLTFEWRGPSNHNGRRAKVAAGLMTGILLKGSQRLKSSELGKQSIRDNYNLASFQYGAFTRVGFGSFALFGKYYFNDMFENSPEQKNLSNFTFGLTLGF
ncbi:outer membrane beta-barrel protein [Sphingobacterium sp. MYb382]|uniref:outer membrane beta-barrel protein n=1 Tax=Sphingobacterium sp. MYb382 TaxID=2745278 RepID=UPI0030B41248